MFVGFIYSYFKSANFTGCDGDSLWTSCSQFKMPDQQNTKDRNKILLQICVLKGWFIPIRPDFDWRGEKRRETRKNKRGIPLFHLLSTETNHSKQKKIKIKRAHSHFSHTSSAPCFYWGKAGKNTGRGRSDRGQLLETRCTCDNFFSSSTRCSVCGEGEERSCCLVFVTHTHTHTYTRTCTLI